MPSHPVLAPELFPGAIAPFGRKQRPARAMLAAICTAAMLAGPAMAQQAGAPMTHPPIGGHDMIPVRPGLINVTGTGESGVAPDMAVISLGVTVQAPTAGEAMAQNAARQQAVIDAIKNHGIEARDIQTSNLSLSPVQDYSQQGKPPVITGYQAGNMVSVRVRDLPQLGTILDAIVVAGANEVQGISFQREDAAKTEADARRKAVHNARERAEVIAGAAGQRLGRLVALSDTQAQSGPPQPMMMRNEMASDAAKTPVETGELRLTAEVTATWEMLPLAGNEGQDGAPSAGGSDGNVPVPATPPATDPATLPAGEPATPPAGEPADAPATDPAAPPADTGAAPSN